MKNLGIILGIIIFTACSSNQTETAKTSAETRNTDVKVVPTPVPPAIPVAHGKEFIKEQFEESYLNLAKAVDGLSKEQIAFKPAPERWSIGETLEHIVKTEPALLGWVQGVMSQPPNPQDRKDITVNDEEILVMRTDRSYKATDPKELVAVGKYVEASTALTDLTNV